MTKERMIELLAFERKCVELAGECDRNCAECNLVQDTNELLDMYNEVISLLKVWRGDTVKMNIKKVIDGLYFTVGMMLFNPATGVSKTPDELNEDDRYTYDACMGAIELLKAQEPVKPILARGWYWCGGIGCRNSLTSALENDIPAHKPNYCERCGRKVKWE